MKLYHCDVDPRIVTGLERRFDVHRMSSDRRHSWQWNFQVPGEEEAFFSLGSKEPLEGLFVVNGGGDRHHLTKALVDRLYDTERYDDNFAYLHIDQHTDLGTEAIASHQFAVETGLDPEISREMIERTVPFGTFVSRIVERGIPTYMSTEALSIEYGFNGANGDQHQLARVELSNGGEYEFNPGGVNGTYGATFMYEILEANIYLTVDLDAFSSRLFPRRYWTEHSTGFTPKKFKKLMEDVLPGKRVIGIDVVGMEPNTKGIITPWQVNNLVDLVEFLGEFIADPNQPSV